MSLLIIAIIVLIVAFLLIAAIDQVGITPPISMILKVVIILGAALIILNRAGLI